MSYRIIDRGLVSEKYKYKANAHPHDKRYFGPEDHGGFIWGFVTDCVVRDSAANKGSFIGVVVALLSKFKNLHEWRTDLWNPHRYNAFASGGIAVRNKKGDVYGYKYSYDSDAGLVKFLQRIPGDIEACGIYLKVHNRLQTVQTVYIDISSLTFSDEYGVHETFIADIDISAPITARSFIGIFPTSQRPYVNAIRQGVDYTGEALPHRPWQYPVWKEVYWAEAKGFHQNNIFYLFHHGDKDSDIGVDEYVGYSKQREKEETSTVCESTYVSVC